MAFDNLQRLRMPMDKYQAGVCDVCWMVQRFTLTQAHPKPNIGTKEL